MKENFQDLDLDSLNIDSFINFLDAKKDTNLHVPLPKVKVNHNVENLHVAGKLSTQEIPLTSVPMPSINMSKDIKIKKLKNIKNLIAEHIKWDKHKVHNFTNTNQKTVTRNYPVVLQDPIPWPPPQKT